MPDVKAERYFCSLEYLVFRQSFDADWSDLHVTSLRPRSGQPIRGDVSCADITGRIFTWHDGPTGFCARPHHGARWCKISGAS